MSYEEVKAAIARLSDEIATATRGGDTGRVEYLLEVEIPELWEQVGK